MRKTTKLLDRGGREGASVDTMWELGRAIGRDIATGGKADAQIDVFISRRHERRLKGEPERELEAAWMASERVQQASWRRANAAG